METKSKQKKVPLARCANCGNTVYFWREMGRLRCQICDNMVDFYC